MNCDELNLLPYIPHDRFIGWESLRPDMNVISRIDGDDMEHVVGGIDNDEDMCDFCRLTGSWHCYVMNDIVSGCPMAFCAIEVTGHNNTILFHGGRVPDYHNTMLVYRGTAIMLKALLDMNYNVETTTEYPRSERFLRALGFVTYGADRRISKMRLTRASLLNSPVYKRIDMSSNE